jgi:hypothetical protein
MRRTDIEGDGEAQGSCGANIPAVSRSAAGETVIAFPQSHIAASSGSAAAGDPRKDPAAFIPLGSAVSAVVMRLGRARPSIKVLAHTTREGDSDLGES